MIWGGLSLEVATRLLSTSSSVTCVGWAELLGSRSKECVLPPRRGWTKWQPNLELVGDLCSALGVAPEQRNWGSICFRLLETGTQNNEKTLRNRWEGKEELPSSEIPVSWWLILSFMVLVGSWRRPLPRAWRTSAKPSCSTPPECRFPFSNLYSRGCPLRRANAYSAQFEGTEFCCTLGQHVCRAGGQQMARSVAETLTGIATSARRVAATAAVAAGDVCVVRCGSWAACAHFGVGDTGDVARHRSFGRFLGRDSAPRVYRDYPIGPGPRNLDWSGGRTGTDGTATRAQCAPF